MLTGLFLSCNKSLTKNLGENIKRVKTDILKSILNKYHDNFEVVLRNINASHILNYNEASFCTDPRKKINDSYVRCQASKNNSRLIQIQHLSYVLYFSE